MMNVLLTILAIVIGYALGNISTGVIVSKQFGGIDIRKHGSGNAGMTNVMRTMGWMPSLLTFVGDVLKGVFAALIGLWLGGQTAAILAGLAVIAGHNWPAAFGFKGGKGIATSFGVILVLQPLVALVLLAIMVAVVAFTHTVSIGALCVSVAYPVINIFVCMFSNLPVFLFSVAAGAMAIFQHRANMGRLIKRNENKLEFSKIKKWNMKK